jgi:hypothetical protein
LTAQGVAETSAKLPERHVPPRGRYGWWDAWNRSTAWPEAAGVPGVAALAARKTGLHFMFTLLDGSIKPIKPATSRTAALDRMVDMCISSGRPGFHVDLVMLGKAAELDERPQRAFASNQQAIWRRFAAPFGPAISLYTGPQVAGLAWRGHHPT